MMQSDDAPLLLEIDIPAVMRDDRNRERTDELRTCLDDLRSRQGFPQGAEDAIVRLSDPPRYTACPNPWLGEGLATETEVPGAWVPDVVTEDIRAGKNDPLYFAHFYPTKVPPDAILPFILRYTKPGDVVLDAFCGTGMTGIAAQLCGLADYVEGRGTVGERRALLVDLGVAPAYIAAVTNRLGHLRALLDLLERTCRQVAADHRDLVVTHHVGWRRGTSSAAERKNRPRPAGRPEGKVEYVVWSDVLRCGACSRDVTYWDLVYRGPGAPEQEEPPCPHCGATVDLVRSDRHWETRLDPVLGTVVRQVLRVPVLINYSVGTRRYEKTPDIDDLAQLEQARDLLAGVRPPVLELPPGFNTDQPRQSHGLTHIHHFFTDRNLLMLTACREAFERLGNEDVRRLGLYLLTGAVQRVCRLNRYMPRHDRHVGPLSGTLYVAPLTAEIPAMNYVLERIEDLRRCPPGLRGEGVRVSTQSATDLSGIPDASVDFVFTDPPFGGNLNYSELNLMVEAWLDVRTEPTQEAVMNPVQKKGLNEYQDLMEQAFAEYHRVLKPGRYIVVEFHNTKNAVWKAIQEALWKAGFVILNVAALDKVKGTTKQLAYAATVKQDLIITAYKPGFQVDRPAGGIGTAPEAAVWEFVEDLLGRLPKWIERDGAIEGVSDRLGHTLFDRVVACFVMRGMAVPLSGPEFLKAVADRYVERDGMFFLHGQVEEYDAMRMQGMKVGQQELFVTDERSAIQWLRRVLTAEPRTFQQLNPLFFRELHSWDKRESRLELLELLEEGFLCYDGTGPVPDQVREALGRTDPELTGRDPTDALLIEAAKNRWYVADPRKQADLEKIRVRALLREFDTYKASRERKLKLFRGEALRVGFRKAFDDRDYQTILRLVEKLPENLVQEDEQILMYRDLATAYGRSG